MDIKKYVSKLPEDLECLNKSEEYQLLVLYVYNEYFDASEQETDSVLEGLFYSRERKFNIDGVFVNQKLEENEIECLYSYHVGSSILSIMTLADEFRYASALIGDAINRSLYTRESPTVSKIMSYLDDIEETNKSLTIVFVTDYIPKDDVDRMAIVNHVSNYSAAYGKTSIKARIVFGDDVFASIESNIAPFDNVSSGSLQLDKADNILSYKDDSFVCNISAKSLKDLWKKEGKRGLLSMNLRYYVKNKKIDEGIMNSVQNQSEDFWYLNNGIIIVCNNYNIRDNKLYLEEFSIVNGGQTTKMIGDTPFDDDFYITCKVIKNKFEDRNTKNEFVSRVAEASNTQKPIKAKDIIANRVELRNLKSLLQDNSVFIEVKRGDKAVGEIYKEPWQKTKSNELAQDLYAFVFLEPGPARNAVSEILSSDEKYQRIFKTHSYNFGFLKSLLLLEKSFKDYRKYVKNSIDEYDNVIKGLVQNGLFYCLSTIGYLLKIYYNPEFKNSIKLYRNNEYSLKTYMQEQAFNHEFIGSKGLTYKQIRTKLYELFDFIFRDIISEGFNIVKASNENIVYSNFTKTNTGFTHIYKLINNDIYDGTYPRIISFVEKYFISISKDQENNNIDEYVDLIKKVKEKNKDIAKNSKGEVISDKDKALRDELFSYDAKTAKEKKLRVGSVLSVTEIEKIIKAKPMTKEELAKCINAKSLYYNAQNILDIVGKYL